MTDDSPTLDPDPARPVAERTSARASDSSDTARIVEIVQTVLTGLILAFIMRAFLVEPFIIPTGSMADALLGAHATRTCPACGWEYDFAPLRASSATPSLFLCPSQTICPNCQLRIPTVPETTVPKAGDRILVHKWGYALGGPLAPKRWDVVVFRDPADPAQHYIKRLIALPGETVELLAGDVFIDGRIARKPRDVQDALWFLVFDQACVAAESATSGAVPRWLATDSSADTGAGWSGLSTRVLHYDALDAPQRRLEFDRHAGSDYFLDLYAYDGGSSSTDVGDVRVRTELTVLAGHGDFQIELTHAPFRFVAEVSCENRVSLRLESLPGSGPLTTWSARAHYPLALRRPTTVEFEHVDCRVSLGLDGHELLATADTEYTPDIERLRLDPRIRPIQLALSARSLRCELRNLQIDRDVHYTSRIDRTRRAGPGTPFALAAEEYFVLGDNSPDSHDSREWTDAGPHLPPAYRPGTVRADQIVGQAAFVYLPGLLPLENLGRWAVPDLGRVRFVR